MQLYKRDNENPQLQPSLHLYHAVIGSFRAQGRTLARWCDENDIRRENARAALHGLWQGPKADAALGKILNAADPETVSFLISKRIGADKNGPL